MPLDSSLGLAVRMRPPGGYSPDELLLAVAAFPDTPPYSIEGMYVYTINQIESADKGRAKLVPRLCGGKDPST